MKPQHAIAVVVVAVLATVAIEETRISKMRAEIIRLRTIPLDEPSNIGAIVAETVDLNDPAQKQPEPAATPAPTPKPEAPAPPSPPTGRIIPDDFPDPDDPTIKQLAIGPNSDFAYEIGLDNRERAYLAELLNRRSRAEQETVAKWISTPPLESSDLEDAMTLITLKSEDEIATFLGSESDIRAFADYHAMRPERDQLAAMAGALDEAGATLEIEKEKQLIEALYQARVGTGSLDWNSPAGLIATAEGGALERFEKEWQTQTEALTGLLPKFLSESETAAVLKSREGLKSDMTASIKAAIEAINGEDE
jgi:hypothetical protein